MRHFKQSPEDVIEVSGRRDLDRLHSLVFNKSLLVHSLILMRSQQPLLWAAGMIDDILVDGISGCLAKDESTNRNHNNPIGHHSLPTG